jgi:3-hydroxybutyryl-CoA dehydrogenase
MVETVGVVGGGIMGSGIAEVSARHGCRVVVREISEGAADAARRRIEASMDKAVHSGKLSADERDAAAGRLTYETDFDALAGCDIVIEAVVEDETEKLAVFRALGKVTLERGTLLASNTSSIPIMRLAAVTENPERVIGMHFFNPVPVLPLVELIPCLSTSATTIERARAFAGERLGKKTVMAKDHAGFVVNALLIPYLLAAIRMVETGFATPDDVDTAMIAGCAHPMGPLALADLIGLDTTAAVADSMYSEFKESLYAPPPLLLRMVEAGRLGRKTGRGFYEYPSGPRVVAG